MSITDLKAPQEAERSTAFQAVPWGRVCKEAFKKLSPRVQFKNPVMCVVYLGSIVTSLLGVQALMGQGEAPAGFIWSIAAWLWFTVLFANAAEAV